MRVAYLVLAHRNPEQLCRLVRRLGPDAPVFVHVDARARDSFPTRIDGCELIPSHRCYWGRFGIVRATLSCIAALVRSGVSYDYAMLLSGQDYPIKPRDRLLAFLKGHPGAEFMEVFPLHLPNRWTTHAGSYQAMSRVAHYHLWFRSHHRSLRIPRRFPAGLTPHGGSQWWCLSRPCLEWVHRFSEERPDVAHYFEHVFIPDESYFHTVIAASPFAANVVKDDLKLAIWDRPEPPYPAVLGLRDARLLMSSRKPFARKFDASVDATVLDFIDRRILHVEPGAALPGRARSSAHTGGHISGGRIPSS